MERREANGQGEGWQSQEANKNSIEGEPVWPQAPPDTGLSADETKESGTRRDLTILELSSTETQALLIGVSRAAAKLQLEIHPSSSAAAAVMTHELDLKAGEVIDLIADIMST